MRIIFMGTPDFAVPSLDILLRNNYNILSVITAPDKPKGRGLSLQYSEVKTFALAHSLKILQPVNLKDEFFKNQIIELKPDIIIVVAFRILPESIFTIPKYGTFNLHASLLPKYRGAAPINYAILKGEKETGVTTFFLDKRTDTGMIIGQKKVSIDDKSFGELYNELKMTGAELVLDTVKRIENKNIELKKQDESLVSYAPKIQKEDYKINWNDSQENIYNLIRAFSPKPGAYTTLDGKLFKILKAEKSDMVCNGETGYAERIGEELVVNTKDKMIKLKEVQMEGKKLISIREFLNGYSNNKIKFI